MAASGGFDLIPGSASASGGFDLKRTLMLSNGALSVVYATFDSTQEP